MLIVHRDVRWEINFIHLSHDGVTLDVDCDVSTAILLVFIRRWRIAVLQSKRRNQHPELYPGWCYRKVIFIKMALRTKYFGRTKNRIQFKIGNCYRHLKNDLEKTKAVTNGQKKNNQTLQLIKTDQWRDERHLSTKINLLQNRSLSFANRGPDVRWLISINPR